MQAIILAGGYGTRISEETDKRPKPMVKIGPRPIIWHIMKIYSTYGISDFVICCGYMGDVIKDYFLNYYERTNDITIDMSNDSLEVTKTNIEPWRITLADTGQDTMTGGRLKRIENHLTGDQFLMTYGDGLADIDINALIRSHNSSGMLATVTAVRPHSRYGVLDISPEGRVESFTEKPKEEENWISGGYFLLNRKVLSYVEDDTTTWERGPMERLAKEGQLNAYKHNGFWHPMDTLRDKLSLEAMWESQKAPWKKWT